MSLDIICWLSENSLLLGQIFVRIFVLNYPYRMWKMSTSSVDIVARLVFDLVYFLHHKYKK